MSGKTCKNHEIYPRRFCRISGTLKIARWSESFQLRISAMTKRKAGKMTDLSVQTALWVSRLCEPSFRSPFEFISNGGYIMAPQAFRQLLRINDSGYIETLDTVVKPQIDNGEH